MERRTVMKKKQVAICVVCAISIILNIILGMNVKNKIQYEEYMKEQYQQESEDKLYGVLTKIDLDFSKMSTDKIKRVLIKEITYCDIATDLVNHTSFSDAEGTFSFALLYTKNYLKELLKEPKLVKTEECNKALEEISYALDEAIYRNDKKYVKKYYEVAERYSEKK